MPEAVVVGAGPAGACAALFLRRYGISVTLVEKEEFPRFRIGESLTGDAARIIRELDLDGHMERAGHPVKRAVRVFGNSAKGNFEVRVQERNCHGELEQRNTWQVSRDKFDQTLLMEARARGADYVRGEAVGIDGPRSRPTGVRVRRSDGSELHLPAKYVLDASGPSAFLSRHGVASPKQRQRYDNQVAIFAQVTGAVCDEGERATDTLIYYRAPHEWSWFIPVDSDHVSIGFVVPNGVLKSYPEDLEQFYVAQLAKFHPRLAERLLSAEMKLPVRAASNYSFEVEDYCGPGFFCMGDSKGFIDPVFSFGVSLAMKDGELAAKAIRAIESGLSEERALDDYREVTHRGFSRVRDFIDAFWGHSLGFSYLVHAKYPEDATDLFAGRVFAPEESRIMRELSELAEFARQQKAVS